MVEYKIDKEIEIKNPNFNKFPSFSDLKNIVNSQPSKKVENKTTFKNNKDKISDNKRRWNIFLTLQGNNEKTPPTCKDIITPLEDMRGRLIHAGVYEYFNECNKILVIGAGDGGEVKLLKEQGYDATGTTLHWSDKKFAKNFYDVDLHIEDMHDMTFTHGTFDGIYSHHSLEHSISPLMSLFELRRVLKNDGKIYICVPQSGTGNETGIQHYSVLTETLWKHLLDIVGFKDIVIYSDSGNTIMKATKDIYKECPGRHFEIELIKEGLYK